MGAFVLQGSREHWKWSVIDYFFKLSDYTKENDVLIWGFSKEEYFNKIKEGDLVFFKTNKNGSQDYGIFGMGEVIEKFVDNKKYWPEEFRGEKEYKWRIKISNVSLIKALEEKLKNLKIDKSKWQNNYEDFFSSEEFLSDIFQGILIKKSYGQGSIISISDKEAQELKNKLLSNNVQEVILEVKDFREFIYKVYESEKRIALNALMKGKNVIFIGPPGSGKTVLAIKVSEEFSKEKNGNGYLLYTVHSGTDYFDLIARIIPIIENDKLVYKKEKRYLLDALLDKRVLILDEINRTQIDTALGIFFTFLEMEHRIQNIDKIKEVIEKETNEKIDIEKLKDRLEFFRVIGTLNVYDKTFLFKLGDALRRRFVFINIGTSKEKIEFIRKNFKTFLDCINFDGDEDIAKRIFSIFEKINEKKELGIGVLKEFLSFSLNYEDEKESIEKSLIHTILHFFENDPKWIEVEEILRREGLNNAAEYLRSLNYGFPTS